MFTTDSGPNPPPTKKSNILQIIYRAWPEAQSTVSPLATTFDANQSFLCQSFLHQYTNDMMGVICVCVCVCVCVCGGARG